MRRALSTAGTIVLAMAVAWPLGRLARAVLSDPPRPPPRGTIITAAGGSLDEIVIQFHQGTGGPTFLAVYAQLFDALSPETTVWVAVEGEADERAFEEARRRWTAPGPVVRYAHVGRRISNWARDRMAVLADAEGDPVLVAPPEAHAGALARANDWHVPWALRRTLGARARIVTAPFSFDGGDLIADDAHVYYGTPLEERNAGRDVEVLRREIEALTGRRPVRLGDDETPAPDHHVGMFVTPLGDGIVAYADPILGSELLFGDAQPPGPISGPPRTITAGGVAYSVDEEPENRRRFARVARDLRGAGVRTVALPVVPTKTPYVWLGYDNAVLDRREDGLHVMMPIYGVPALDEAAAEIYRSLGATVHPVDVSEIFHHGGTVRCLVAVLRRSRAPRAGA